jgi:hypothetical protein
MKTTIEMARELAEHFYSLARAIEAAHGIKENT